MEETHLVDYVIPRCFNNEGEVLVFCDTSQNAFGYAIYIDCNLFFGKSKLFTKSTTIVDKEL